MDKNTGNRQLMMIINEVQIHYAKFLSSEIMAMVSTTSLNTIDIIEIFKTMDIDSETVLIVLLGLSGGRQIILSPDKTWRVNTNSRRGENN